MIQAHPGRPFPIIQLLMAMVLWAGCAGGARADDAPLARELPARAEAVFAGGCFWCMEKPFDDLPGVISTTSGYMGGHVKSPTYKQVAAGGTGHAEVVQVIFDPTQVSYEDLLAVFWRNVDPFDANGQFCDKGSQYRVAVFFKDAAQRDAARASIEALQPKFEAPIVTTLEPYATFYPAEAYHQDYYLKNPLRYRYYRHGCGRDRRLEAIWGQAK
ncbi:peptide-methionine (S)-S-oxide reductase MsrA [Simiduia sp. 21SJ11W-1]|uniref:peptide-methionine (S)-S-oxide reductase MsrA n=1 Tax=Simiduia sp. 21SJ11W-1 TaxID=2909669 RepID=UPI00209EFA6C|nr:peptide-methionine (S)-S-oxide reductase MsrA [Simiduia sp. 21SJ11W-1]UTA48685.1 peptide-methionine (S)-S-oxide reductase MsrA [Simiduia sp. 21SJ11W-1]